MLQANFKSAEELEITQESHTALMKLLRMMEGGELKWTDQHTPTTGGFNMARVWAENECGSVGCIMGWTKTLGGSTFLTADRDKRNSAIDHLCCPPGWGAGLHTVEQAAHALRTFLVTGWPEWPERPTQVNF